MYSGTLTTDNRKQHNTYTGRQSTTGHLLLLHLHAEDQREKGKYFRNPKLEEIFKSKVLLMVSDSIQLYVHLSYSHFMTASQNL